MNMLRLLLLVPRLFVAIEEWDPTARDRVGEQQRLAARRSEDQARQREHLHLTLVFLGHTRAEDVPAIEQAMNRDVDQRPFAVRLGGSGVFPERGAPRAVWLAVQAGEPQIVALQEKIVSRVEDCGVAVERRRFHPHLTLARWKTRGRSLRPRGADGSTAVASFDVTRRCSRARVFERAHLHRPGTRPADREAALN